MVNIEDLELEKGTIILEPQLSYNKAIIGVSIDSKHIIYQSELENPRAKARGMKASPFN